MELDTLSTNMPNYEFSNPETGEIGLFFFPATQAPKVGALVEIEGKQWRREFSLPLTGVDTKIDPFSQKQFREKTYGKKGETVGSMWDRSKELSEMRAAKSGGTDPVRAKYLADYKKSRRGTPHTVELKESQEKAKTQFNEGLKKLGLSASSANFSGT